jgi:hypothetical protein
MSAALDTRTDRAAIAAAALAGGWRRVDAWHNTGYERGLETLTVTLTDAGRASHATHTVYHAGGWALSRRSSAPEALTLAVTALLAPHN